MHKIQTEQVSKSLLPEVRRGRDQLDRRVQPAFKRQQNDRLTGLGIPLAGGVLYRHCDMLAIAEALLFTSMIDDGGAQ